MTTKEDIRRWIENAKKEGASHLIVVCDTYDYEDYPVAVAPGTDPSVVFNKYMGESMQRPMECYNLSLDIESQLNEQRSYHFEPWVATAPSVAGPKVDLEAKIVGGIQARIVEGIDLEIRTALARMDKAMDGMTTTIVPNRLKTRDEGIRRSKLPPGAPGSNKAGVGVRVDRKKAANKLAARRKVR